MVEADDGFLAAILPLADPVFQRGFEMGVVWQRLMAGERDFGVTVRPESDATCRRMAAALGLGCEVYAVSGVSDSVVVTFLSAPAPRPALRLLDGGRA